MTNQLYNANVTEYDFFEAVDGRVLTPSSKLFDLFERNDFNYKKGVIGCALSHIYLWDELINDTSCDFYVILEDDVEFCENFKQQLDYVCKLFSDKKVDHLSLGEYNSAKPFATHNSVNEIYSKNVYEEGTIAFGYIISKDAAKKAIQYIDSCPIKCAIDNPQALGNILDYYSLTHRIIECKTVNQYGTDIQHNHPDNYFIVNNNNFNKASLTVAYCDWWESEYC
jgi:GR25 family glycosyltransferase involved in LPS biosynthesis